MVEPVLIGRVIRDLRQSKGKSQEVISGLAGLDRTHYSKIERGLRSPTIETLFKIAHALDMEPHELVKEIENARE
ncbi:MAG: helix-turn-helix transcriptional regulator [Clostridia bacterium]|nr:helix-turn-helix transcriptional regulator [Clostridia bacterium]